MGYMHVHIYTVRGRAVLYVSTSWQKVGNKYRQRYGQLIFNFLKNIGSGDRVYILPFSVQVLMETINPSHLHSQLLNL